MGRRAVGRGIKKAIASRIQGLLDERFDSFYAFKKWVGDAKHPALASTVKNWLPPQTRWRAKPEGAGVRGVDWDEITLPDPATLIEFCDLLDVRADYILFGDGTPGRQQTRPRAELGAELAVYVASEVRQRIASEVPERIAGTIAAENIDSAAILRDAVDTTAEDVRREHALALQNQRAVELSNLVSGLARFRPAETQRKVEQIMEEHESGLAMSRPPGYELRFLRDTGMWRREAFQASVPRMIAWAREGILAPLPRVGLVGVGEPSGNPRGKPPGTGKKRPRRR